MVLSVAPGQVPPMARFAMMYISTCGTPVGPVWRKRSVPSIDQMTVDASHCNPNTW